MKKILSILVCVLLGFGSALAADLTINAKAYVYNSIGGQVAANQSETTPNSGWETSATNKFTKKYDSYFLGTNKWNGYALYYHARSSEGYTFMGWSNDNNGSVDDTQSALCLNVSSTKAFSQFLGGTTADDVKTRYAIFRPIFQTQTEEIVLYLEDDGSLSSYTLPIVCNKTKELLIDYPTDIFSIDNSEVSAALQNGGENQNFSIVLSKNPSYTGALSIGERLYTITFTPQSNGLSENEYNSVPVVLYVSIRRASTITFNPSTIGGGYSYVQDNGLGQTIVVDSELKSAVVKGEGNDKAFSLSASSASSYRFRRWVINRSIGGLEYLYDSVTISNIECDATVTAEFISTDCAQFVVLPDIAKQYAHMEDAFDVAQKLGKTVVSVYQPGSVTITTDVNGNASNVTLENVNREWILPSGEYTIPTGYTLLVPGLEKSNLTGNASSTLVKDKLGYTYQLGKSTENDYLETAPSPKLICKLIVAEGTTINVNGNISVYSCLSASQGSTGRPTGYGQIHLQNGSHIQLNNGSTLHVMGYITGDTTTTSVLANKGSQVYEVFQITDWRGGTAMAGGEVTNFLLNSKATLVNNSYEVFPIGQYYVQNIETMLKIEAGAKEWLTTAVDVSNPFPLTTEFINVVDADADELGLFVIDEGVEIQKYYDSVNDRLKLKIIGGGTNTIAKLSYMYLEVKVDVVITTVDASLNTSKYVLPINNNIDVTIDNVKLNVPYKCAFMAGSSLTVSPDAQLNIQNEMFLYDAELNVQPEFAIVDGANYGGYYASGSFALKPITYTASHLGAPNKREAEHMRYPTKLDDATFVIDGTLTMEGKGALYTTTYSSVINNIAENRDTNKDFGANITSNDGGVLNFNSVGTKTTTNQISQTGTTPSWITNIPICNAWLRNADGTRSAGPSVEPGDTYMYKNGQWFSPKADLRNVKGTDFKLTLPKNKTQNVECEVIEHDVLITDITATIQEGNLFEVGTPVLSTDRKNLTIPVTYKYTGVHNVGNANAGNVVVTIVYTDSLLDIAQTKSVEIPVTATEDYTPKFSVKIGETTFNSGDSYSMTAYAAISSTSTVTIIPEQENVATLLDGEGWTASFTAPFEFTYGTPNATSFANTLIYSTQTEGSHSVTLKLIATYKDASQTEVQSEFIINLIGKATKQPNSLALIEDLRTEVALFQTETIESIFDNLGNGNPITFTYGGQSESDLVKIEKVGDNYRLIALEKEDETEAKEVEIIATQEATDIMERQTITFSVTIFPQATWNWGKLYFNSTATRPVITMNEVEPWRLEVIKVEPESLIISLDAKNGYAATIGTPMGEVDTYTAKFKFTQGNYEKEFTSTIYADPRILPYCVDTERTYGDVTITKTGVTFDDATNAITFEPTAILEVEMKGVPEALTFTPTGGNAWRVMERASTSGNWSAVVDWTSSFVGDEMQTLRLKPTTRFIQIQYGAQTENAGTITNLCISKLDMVADVDLLYLPIGSSGKEIVLTHADETTPTITLGLPLKYTTITSDNLGTEEEPYYTTTVTIQADNTVEEGTYAFIAMQGTCTINVSIRAYSFPQELPIKWAVDVAERYYFETVDSRYVKWNETDKTLLLQTSGQGQSRYVTFAFNGAPSVISFNVSQSLATGGTWTISESANGESYSDPVSVAVVTTDDGKYYVRYDGLHYTTRYVRVSYIPTVTTEGTISDLVIEGYPMAIVNPENLFFSEEQLINSFALTAINLKSIRVELDNNEYAMTHGNEIDENTLIESSVITLSATNNDYANALGVNKVGNIRFWVEWKNTGKVNSGNINIYDGETAELLATVKIVGSKNSITLDNGTAMTGIYTGIPTGYTLEVKNGETAPEYTYHEVDIKNAFSTDGNKTPLFDYLIIYGETKTDGSSTTITLPTSQAGSNSVTPYYVYKKAQSGETTGYDSYQFVKLVDNANTSDKEQIDGFTTTVDGATYIDVDGSLSVYITGFCPYATTGMTKEQEGAWFFRGENEETLDVYLEDCHIYSRNKTELGIPMNKDDKDAPIFTEGYARGSGGVLVFENTTSAKNTDLSTVIPFAVNVHTIGNNTLKSNFGCFFSLFSDVMRAYQISAPLHIHMNSDKHVHNSKTELTLDDVWPTTLDENRVISASMRTNGFLSLQKQSNNAPSIDLGSPHSVVNFSGGQVELQNAQIVSPNYKTTLAISYRSGEFGGDGVGIKLAYGIGTDSVGGTVNFYDGTTTVLPMKVDEKYRQYYLMDVDADGNELETTSCLRCPKNTYVHGGSQCFMRACSHVTSQGGAPKDWKGKLLGQYVYDFDLNNNANTINDRGLVTGMLFPGCVGGEVDGVTLSEYYGNEKPRWNSITPINGKLYFWIPDGFGGVKAESDKKLIAWKACMTEIQSGYQHLSGTVGGDVYIDPTGEKVKNFLYCQIDKNIHDVITAGGTKDEFGNFENPSYMAPVQVPKAAQGLAEGEYMNIQPTFVGKDLAYQVETEGEYVITDNIYYITTATADVWMTFTAPFNVANIYVVETYSEAELESLAKSIEESNKKNNLSSDNENYINPRDVVLREQAKHNADFAAFFGVAMALGSDDDFETIFNNWKEWGIAEDRKASEGGVALYDGSGSYNLRGKYLLTPYNGTNWNTANFYLNHNNGTWDYEFDDELGESFNPKWEIPTATNGDGVLLEKGETYSLLFPYCVGCWEMENTDDGYSIAKKRKYWDYWSGKILIFEGKKGEQTINGSDFLAEDNESGVFKGEEDLGTTKAYLRGNSTFAFMETEKKNVYSYVADPNNEEFTYEGDTKKLILPTQSFLLAPEMVDEIGLPQILSISRMGKIKYRTGDNNGDDTPTGGEHVPTVGGGSDIFVTSVAEGINIAVSEPQYVGVFSATGALLYNGWVETAVDVNLVVNGVYVVVGENNSVKVIY